MPFINGLKAIAKRHNVGISKRRRRVNLYTPPMSSERCSFPCVPLSLILAASLILLLVLAPSHAVLLTVPAEITRQGTNLDVATSPLGLLPNPHHEASAHSHPEERQFELDSQNASQEQAQDNNKIHPRSSSSKTPKTSKTSNTRRLGTSLFLDRATIQQSGNPPPLVTQDQLDARPHKPNVVLIIADDFRVDYPQIGLNWDHSGGSAFATPNIVSFAQQSIVFDNAYTAFPVCGPSRTTLLTGRTPQSHGWMSDASPFWRNTGTVRVTLPQHFKNNGYTTNVIGKVFHYTPLDPYDAPSWSWSNDVGPAGPTSGGEFKCPNGGNYCPCQGNCVDFNLATAFAQRVAQIKQSNLEPFFFAIGFHRPHLDWSVDASWFSSDPASSAYVPLPGQRSFPPSVPDIAFFQC